METRIRLRVTKPAGGRHSSVFMLRSQSRDFIDAVPLLSSPDDIRVKLIGFGIIIRVDVLCRTFRRLACDRVCCSPFTRSASAWRSGDAVMGGGGTGRPIRGRRFLIFQPARHVVSFISAGDGRTAWSACSSARNNRRHVRRQTYRRRAPTSPTSTNRRLYARARVRPDRRRIRIDFISARP